MREFVYIYIWELPNIVGLKHPPEDPCVSGTVSESVSGCFRVCVSDFFEFVSGVAFQHAFQPFLMARFRLRFSEFRQLSQPAQPSSTPLDSYGTHGIVLTLIPKRMQRI